MTGSSAETILRRMSETPPIGPLTASQFFALKLPGGTVADASEATGLAYTTVQRVRDCGGECRADTVKRVAAWSRDVLAAKGAGVWIDAARTLGIASEDEGAA